MFNLPVLRGYHLSLTNLGSRANVATTITWGTGEVQTPSLSNLMIHEGSPTPIDGEGTGNLRH